jgi:hypothetical protein
MVWWTTFFPLLNETHPLMKMKHMKQKKNTRTILFGTMLLGVFPFMDLSGRFFWSNVLHGRGGGFCAFFPSTKQAQLLIHPLS